MQVERLRLVGFKSFVEATELEIRPGLTAIVGPNGCGKSNLAEALRWVMGENSARRLRGGEMDDLIFAGAAVRPPCDTAEVALTLDNSTRTAPRACNDRDEIEIVRRIERCGASVFRINGREVRARDVQALFADAAAGGQFGTVIGQGRVGALIEAKPAERRQLLEEAAGTAGHQLRRREAVQRLAAAEANLARLDDVVATLIGQRDVIKHQARQAQRYRRLAEEIRCCEQLLFRARRREAAAEVTRAVASLAAVEAVVATREAAAAAARRRRDAADAALPALRHAETSRAAELGRLGEARAGLERELRRVVNARGEAERRQIELAADLEREEGQLADAQAALIRLAAERQGLAGAASPDRERDAAALRLTATAERLAAAEAQLQRAIEADAEAEARRAAVERQSRDHEARRLRLERLCADTAARQAALAREIVPPEMARAAAAEVAEAEGRAAALATAVETAEIAVLAGQSQEAMAFEAHQKAAARHGRLDLEAETLQAALATVPGANGARPVLAVLRVAAGFEAAIGALFDGELAAPLGVDSGAACFWVNLPAAAAAVALPEGAHSLSAAVAAPAALGRRLGQSGWVEDKETGRRLQPRLRPGQCLVDRDGRLWRWDGFTRTEPARSAAAKHLQQHRRLAALADETAVSKSALRSAETVLAAARADRQRAAEALRQAQIAAHEAEAALTAARAAEAALGRRALAAETRLAALEETAAQLAIELAETAAAIDENNLERAALPAAAMLHKALEEARSVATEALRRQAEARGAIDQLAQATATRRERLLALDLEESAWRKRADSAAAQCAVLGERQAASRCEFANLADRPTALAAESEALGGNIAAAATAARAAADALVRGEAALHEAREHSQLAERALAEAREQRARLEVVRDGANDTLIRLDRDIVERLGIATEALAEFSGTDVEGQPADPVPIAARLERLVRERDGIGPVNLVAESEAAEIDARIQALQREHGELTEAIGKLRRGIEALDREARQRLTQALERVGCHFAEVFDRLFGGGRAELKLTDDADALSAGLEIMASPSGKRLQNLALLSGGEQALTALALIFAVFLTNPAPICVLDEVDAPLDDANVERLCRLVAETADATGTRFLVVTHHRITMARADRLYGVTMAEPGVSRLVSVELAAAVRLRQTA
jgi:chromosome segregation protein